jgi:hypothetical protein
MNPKYLLWDELVFELAIWGVNVEGDVHLLHKIFGSVLAEGVSTVLENVAGLDAGVLLL